MDRIDHGVNSLEKDELWHTIREKGLGLTVCPVCNRFVVQTLTDEAIRSMLAKGIKVTINSDDPSYFRAYLNENLMALHNDAGFTRDEIATLVGNSFDIAWLAHKL